MRRTRYSCRVFFVLVVLVAGIGSLIYYSRTRLQPEKDSSSFTLIDDIRNGEYQNDKTVKIGIVTTKLSSTTSSLLSSSLASVLSPQDYALQLIQNMTLDEKISLLHGQENDDHGYIGFAKGVPRLGIPDITLNDGPQGYRDPNHHGTTTSFTCALGVASTFDTTMARLWGKTMGKEFQLKGSNVQLGPGLNIARVMSNGRNFEYLSGEDPILGYYMSYATIRGIQSQGVVANAKHFIFNNQETNRVSVSVEDIKKRTRMEIFYPPFLGAIHANVGSIMCSYNKIFGKYSCESSLTLGKELRNELGFGSRSGGGWVVSDWWATHSTMSSMFSGLDQEMPNDRFYGQRLLDRISKGQISEYYVDQAVRRILIPMIQLGLIPSTRINNDDVTVPSNNATVTSKLHRHIAQRIATDGLILLKNENHALPLKLPRDGSNADNIENSSASPNNNKHHFFGHQNHQEQEQQHDQPQLQPQQQRPYTIAILGFADASTQIYSGGGSGHVSTWRESNAYTALYREVIGPDPRHPKCHEFKYDMEYTMNSQIIASGIQPPNFKCTSPSDCCHQCKERPGCAYWTYNSDKQKCTLHAEGTAELIHSSTQDMFVSGSLYGENQTLPECNEAGTRCIKYENNGDGSNDIEQSQSVASAADVAIVFVQFMGTTEGKDRATLRLDADQEALITSVAAVARSTIVVVTAPGAVVLSSPWHGQVDAILLAFLPGEQSGPAMANILLGYDSPSGRLPLSLPRTENDMNWPEMQYPGVNGHVYYTEQLKVGYRWYHSNSDKVSPLYSFGHGLSYTTFEYTHFTIKPVKTATTAILDAVRTTVTKRNKVMGTHTPPPETIDVSMGDSIEVSVWLTNTGSTYSSKEVTMLFLTYPSFVQEPPMQLKYFTKTPSPLAPSETQSISFTLTPNLHHFSIYNGTTNEWEIPKGEYSIFIASSKGPRQPATNELTFQVV